jgi:Penicillin-insensitive murein endopeptidase
MGTHLRPMRPGADPFAPLDEISGTAVEEWTGEGEGEGGAPVLPARADPAVNTPLPEAGPGLRAYQPRAERRWGRPETIAALHAIGAAWQTGHTAGPRMQVGDISLRGGGPMPPHKSHQTGLDVDIRPLRGDAREAPVRHDDAAYSRPLTQQLVDTIRGNPAARVGFIFFNDPQVKGVRPWPGHENHLHVRFVAGSAPAAQAPTVGALAAPPQTAGLAAAHAAIAQGQRDISRLTDIVFFARHPERRGRRLHQRERPLIREWTQIRDQIIRPMLRSSAGGVGTRGTAPVGPRPAAAPVAWRPSAADVQRFRGLLPLIEKYRGDMPLPFVLGWIYVESGGRIGSLTSLDERGFFQLHPGESKILKADHRRLSTDSDYSMRMGIELMKHRFKGAEKLGFQRDTQLFWRIVKFLHWAPAAVAVILQEMRKAGIAPTSWDAIKGFVAQQRDRLRLAFKARWGKAYDPLKGTANVDKVFERGRALAAALGLGG